MILFIAVLYILNCLSSSSLIGVEFKIIFFNSALNLIIMFKCSIVKPFFVNNSAILMSSGSKIFPIIISLAVFEKFLVVIV